MANEEQKSAELEENAEIPAQESSVEHAGLSEVDELKKQLELARQEAAEAKDQALRVQAESQNVRRRAERDVESAHKYALEKFCAELLPVVDNLERAQDAADKDNEVVKPLYEGVELTHKSFLDVLKKFNVEQLDPVGEPFDPQLHEAMAMIESPDVEPNTVINVMQKGFTLNGRLIRAAMVVVSKPAAKVDESV